MYKLFSILIGLTIIISCIGETGPTGPEGPAGSDGVTTTVYITNTITNGSYVEHIFLPPPHNYPISNLGGGFQVLIISNNNIGINTPYTTYEFASSSNNSGKWKFNFNELFDSVGEEDERFLITYENFGKTNFYLTNDTTTNVIIIRHW